MAPHGDMDMGSSMDMASMAHSTMSMAHSMASSTMDMASHTMDMASSTMDMASSTMDMASSTSTSMASMHGMSHMGSMHMYFTREYESYPVLFKTLYAKTKAQAFGIFVFLFAMAFIARGFEFLKLYLEHKVWKDDSNIPIFGNVVVRDTKEADIKNVNFDDSDKLSERSKPPQGVVNGVVRDIILLVLCFLPDLFGYALMLAAMTYTLTYFFAVVVGSACGRFFFEKMARKLKIRPEGVFGRHC